MRKILIITGSRADRSPLEPVLTALLKTGGCFVTRLDTTGLWGHENGIREELEREKPDFVLLLGDRYETLVAASVCTLMCVPICHIHGGEETVGAVDNGFRHAITKLSYYHFAIHEDYAKRIIQMGESPDRVFVTGAPGVDQYAEVGMTRAAIEAELGIELKSPVALVCVHPETLGADSFSWLEDLKLFDTLIISGANADPGGESINKFWQGWRGRSDRSAFRPSYGQRLWTSLMREADVLIGNSSCFILEGFTLGKEVINIGDRQKGRYEEALKHFADNPYAYGKPGEVSPKIAELLLTLPIPDMPRKEFRDIAY